MGELLGRISIKLTVISNQLKLHIVQQLAQLQKKYRTSTGYDVSSKILFLGYRPFLAAQTCCDR